MSRETIIQGIANTTRSPMSAAIMANLIAQLSNEETAIVRENAFMWFKPNIKWMCKNTNLKEAAIYSILNLLKKFGFIEKAIDGGVLFVAINFEKLEELNVQEDTNEEEKTS
jgi:hypothetical protein